MGCSSTYINVLSQWFAAVPRTLNYVTLQLEKPTLQLEKPTLLLEKPTLLLQVFHLLQVIVCNKYAYYACSLKSV